MHRTTARDRLILFVIILLPALLLFAETLSFGFMSDDFYLVHRVSDEGFFSGWGGSAGTALFRPVTVFSYLTDHLLWGLNAVGYHLTNVLWHLVNSLLVVILANNLLKRTDAAISAGFVFLLLACHSESVSWVSGRTDLIATAFCLASILLFLRGSWWSLPAFLIGVMAKESVIIAPLLWASFLVEGTRRNKKAVTLVVTGVTVSAVFILVRVLCSNDFASDLNSVGAGGFTFPGALENLIRYSFRVLIPPLPLSLRCHVLGSPLIVVIFLSFVLLFMWLPRRKKIQGHRMLFILAGCFVVSLLPVISMKVSLFDSQSERFLYLPGVFAVIALVEWAFIVFSNRTALVILLVFGLLQGVFLYRSNRNWKTAGEICETIALEVYRNGMRSVEIPDNYNGAYVFRNGLSEAISMLR